jgi:serine/threonine protein phosphatase PrpC
VSAEPDIRTYTLGPEDEFLIVGCDGVWDVVTHQEAVDLCSSLLRREFPPSDVVRGNPPYFVDIAVTECMQARLLVEYAFAKGSTDNISACVVVFDHNVTSIELPPA